ncbi:MAG TPA: sigma-70 family RNA polymerase sigma factor [Chloroflexota bacterium]|nr:sigma-70 family RNA polymerase sigma factor [Chloroflexota bacterium]
MAVIELSLDSTQHLVQQSRAGDESAFAELVVANQSAVFGTVLRLVRDREVAAEVSNRAFFKAYEHLASFDESRPLRAWLLRIAANEALNELRSRRRDAANVIGGAEAEIELEQLGGPPDPGELVVRRESRAAIRDAVSRLPEPQRVAVVLRYFADLAYADIAELTQQSVNSVGVTLLRARARLRQDLELQGVATDGLP